MQRNRNSISPPTASMRRVGLGNLALGYLLKAGLQFSNNTHRQRLMNKKYRPPSRLAAELSESIKGWRQGDADADAILREYGDFIFELASGVKKADFEPMLFSEFVKGCTQNERTKLAQHLAMIRMVKTLKLADTSRDGQ